MTTGGQSQQEAPVVRTQDGQVVSVNNSMLTKVLLYEKLYR
jgi:hypothetical protein